MAGVDGPIPAGGYDYEFVDLPPDSLECSICHLVFRDPHLTSCCGNHFCGGCIARAMKEKHQCPLCTESMFTVLLDRGVQRKVNELKINCTNKDRGCSWVGEVGKLQDHITPIGVKHGCKYEVVECSQGCGERLQRRFMRQHQNRHCICRPYVCDYCEYGSIYEDVRHNHWPVCPNYPVRCPNKCEVKTVTRSHLDKHLMEECPLEKVECEFNYAGCKTRIPRKDMAAHVRENFLQHISQISAVNISLLDNMQQKELKITKLKNENQGLKQDIIRLNNTHACEKKELESRLRSLESQAMPVPPFSFTMPNFDKHQEESDRWFSPFFYSRYGGYKMCLRIDANGIMVGKDTHISVLVHFAPGQYDDQLPWPFRGSITLQLLNQRSNTNHYEITIPFTDATPENAASRVRHGTMATWGWGCYTYIPHEDLQYDQDRNCEYLMNNCLQFKVKDCSGQ